MNIEILGDRFIGMFKEEVDRGFVLRLEVDFTSKIHGLKWEVFNKKNAEGVDIIHTVSKNLNNINEIYHVLGMEGVITFTDLIKHAKHIIDFNIEVEEKKILLKEKFDELGELFAKHTIEDLRKLDFVFKKGNAVIEKTIPKKEKVVEVKPKTTIPKKQKEKVVDDIELLENKEEIIE